MSGTQISDMTVNPTLPAGSYVPFVVLSSSTGLNPASNYIFDLGTALAGLTGYVTTAALAASTGAALVGIADGGTLQAWIDAPTVRNTSTTAFRIYQDDGTLVYVTSTVDTYSGTGTGLTGAPRIYVGTKTPSGDDSAICIGRELTGSNLFSHAVRDETTFASTSTGAYASFDANPIMSGGTAYNHLYGLQGRPDYSGSLTLSVLSGCTVAPIQHSGVVTTVAGLTCQNSQFLGGTRTNHYGVHVETLSAPTAGTAFAFFADNNDSALLGNLQILGNLTGVTTGSANSWEAIGGVAAFNAIGGIQMWGNGGSAAYGRIRAYSDGSGTAKGLAIQDNGGQVLIGATSPTTGATVEITGSLSTTGNATLGDAAGDLATVTGKLILATTATPASAAATGTTGTVAWDASFIYICVATNTWKRVAIATW